VKMASAYDIQHMFFKRQTGIKNHTEQLDGFGEVNAHPRDVYTSGQVKLWQPFARAKHEHQKQSQTVICLYSQCESRQYIGMV